MPMKLIWNRKRNRRLRSWNRAHDIATTNHKLMLSFWETDDEHPIKNVIIIYKEKFPDFKEWCTERGYSFKIIF